MTRILLAILGIMFATSPAADADTARGWSEFWTGRTDSALVEFSRTLQQDDTDASARRGLILALMMRGNEREALSQLKALGAAKKASASDLLLAKWIYKTSATSGRDEQLFQSVCKQLSEIRGIDLLDRRAVLAALGEFAVSNADLGTARKVAAELGRIGNWTVLGPLDNVSMSGHAKQFLDANDGDFAHEYVGKAGLPLRAFGVGTVDALGSLNFVNHFERTNNITAYAACRLSVGTGGKYLLSLGKTGAIIVTVDGCEILRRDDVGSQDEFDHFELELAKGCHTLVLKVSGERLAPAVSASVLSLEGKRVKDLTAGNIGLCNATHSAVSFARRPLPLMQQFVERVARDSTDAEAAFWYLIGLKVFNLPDDARAAAQAASRRFPNSAALQYACSEAFQTADDTDAAEACMRRCNELDRTHAQSALWLAVDHMQKGESAAADSILLALIARSPDCVTGRLALLASYRNRSLQKECAEVARAVLATAGDFSDPLDVLASQAEALGDHAEAMRLRARSMHAMPRGQEFVYRFVQATEKDDLSRQVDELNSIRALFPDVPVLRTSLAAAMLRSGDFQSGLAVAEETARLFPNVAGPQLILAAIEDFRSTREPDRREVAARLYNHVLALKPGDFEVRDKLRSLQGLQPVSAIMPALDLDKVRASAPRAAEYPDADACVLLDQFRRIVFEDGSSYGERAVVVKAFTKKGVESFGSISLDVNPLFSDLTVKEARTLKPDGREVRAETGINSVAFRDVAPGDIVELHYGASSWSLGGINREFWDSHEFQWTVPCRRSRYELLVPTGRAFQWVLHNAPDGAVVVDSTKGRQPPAPASPVESWLGVRVGKSSGGRSKEAEPGMGISAWQSIADSVTTLLRGAELIGRAPAPAPSEFDHFAWTMENVAPRTAEPASPPYRDVATWLDISTLKNWAPITRWYRDLSEGSVKSNPLVRGRAEDLVRGITERERKIARLCDFVTNEVAYENLDFQYGAFVPAPAPRVLTAMYGDCKDKVCLLRSMLDVVGVPTMFVLVNPRYRGDTPFLPSARFSHAILAIRDSVGLRFVDPTAKDVPLGRLPWSIAGGNGLLIEVGTDQLVTLPEPSHEEMLATIVTNARIDAGGTLHLVRHETRRSDWELANLRGELQGATSEKRDRFLVEELGAHLVGVRVAKAQWTGLDALADSVDVVYEAIADNAVTSVGALRVMRVPWRSRVQRALGSLVAVQSRKEALLLDDLQLCEDETLTLAPPDGWELQQLPESRSFRGPSGSCNVQYARRGRDVVAHRRLTIDRGRVEPDAYPAFKGFLESVIREQDAAFVLSPASAPQAISERPARRK